MRDAIIGLLILVGINIGASLLSHRFIRSYFLASIIAALISTAIVTATYWGSPESGLIGLATIFTFAECWLVTGALALLIKFWRSRRA
jgi:disulfide bond formation protein DsbB